jgi:hypothetical protein
MQSTSTDPSQSVRFSEPEEIGESATYQPVSAYAVLGLVIAIVALVVVLVTRSPIPAVLAFASAAFSYFGLRQTVLQSEIYSGKGIAFAALLISCLTGAWGVAYGVSRETARQKQAKEFTEAFLFCVAHDRVNEAHQFYDERFDGRDRSQSLAEYYRSEPELAKTRDGFSEMPPLGAIFAAARAGKEVKYSLVSVAKEKGRSETENYRTIWRVEIPSDREGGYPTYIFPSFFVECEVKSNSTRWRLAQIVEAPPDIRWK